MFTKITESDSIYSELEKMSVSELLTHINDEDKKVPLALEAALSSIQSMVEAILPLMLDGGRLFYIGAGTSGRLGILDASECPPTFGVPHNMVIGLIAGGDKAIRKAVEFVEDDTQQGWNDLLQHNISEKDFVIGIAASGTTPYVMGAIEKCNAMHISTGAITCNKNSPLSLVAKYPVELIVGPEFVTGSTRMKSGTAQKLALNMISTSLMIRLGRVKGNKMVDMQLSNHKLINRGVRMLVHELQINEDQAAMLLEKHGSVREAVKKFRE